MVRSGFGRDLMRDSTCVIHPNQTRVLCILYGVYGVVESGTLFNVESGMLFNNLINQFIRLKLPFLAMSSPLSTANPTPAILIPKILASAVRDMPNSLAAQSTNTLCFYFSVLPPLC